MGLFGKKAVSKKSDDSEPSGGAGLPADGSEEEGAGAAAVVEKKPKKKVVKKKAFNFFANDIPSERPLADPDFEYRRYLRLIKRVKFEASSLVVLVVVFVIASHLFKDENRYLARRIGAPIGSETQLSGLTLPVLTKEAICSWSMTAVTEILTFNFSNYNERLAQHTWRFHPEGWKAYVKAMIDTNTLREFSARQLVSTAAPDGSAVIDSEGINEETQEYEWKVKVPIIRKFVTNNDRSEVRRSDIFLTLVRTPLNTHVTGIGIKVWREQ